MHSVTFPKLDTEIDLWQRWRNQEAGISGITVRFIKEALVFKKKHVHIYEQIKQPSLYSHPGHAQLNSNCGSDLILVVLERLNDFRLLHITSYRRQVIYLILGLRGYVNRGALYYGCSLSRSRWMPGRLFTRGHSHSWNVDPIKYLVTTDIPSRFGRR